jgi:predicted phosphodiesterase
MAKQIDVETHDPSPYSPETTIYEEATSPFASSRQIFVISDIHSEFYEDDEERLLSNLPKIKTKFCILAGDVGNVTTQPKLLKSVLLDLKTRHEYVLMVPGNHEYYECKYDRDSVLFKLREICDETKTILLFRSNIVIEGINFIGATLWSAIDDYGASSINDFSSVFKHKVDYLEAFIDDYRFIKQALYENIGNVNPTVVITHHLPTVRLIHPRFKKDPINSAFASEILDLLPTRNIRYWFCGHTHEFGQCKYGDTQIICNPVGYPGESRRTKLSTVVYEI